MPLLECAFRVFFFCEANVAGPHGSTQSSTGGAADGLPLALACLCGVVVADAFVCAEPPPLPGTGDTEVCGPPVGVGRAGVPRSDGGVHSGARAFSCALRLRHLAVGVHSHAAALSFVDRLGCVAGLDAVAVEPGEPLSETVAAEASAAGTAAVAAAAGGEESVSFSFSFAGGLKDAAFGSRLGLCLCVCVLFSLVCVRKMSFFLYAKHRT